MAVKIDPVWPTPQDCRHRDQGDFFQPTQPRYLMQLTPAITCPQGLWLGIIRIVHIPRGAG